MKTQFALHPIQSGHSTRFPSSLGLTRGSIKHGCRMDTPVEPEYDKKEAEYDGDVVNCHSALDAESSNTTNSLLLDTGVKHQYDRRVESGRSMVEILGTLAIIGVLSIGGIAGYSYGMDKWRANEVINDVNMRMIDIAGQVFRNQSEIAIPEDWDIKGRSGYVIDVFQNTDSEPSIMVEGVPSSVCKMILKNSADTQDIYVGVLNGEQVDGNWYLGNNEDICEGSDKEMLFAMSPEILAGFNPEDPDYVETEPPQLECYSNADCSPDKPYCDTYYGQCVTCLENSHCGGDTPVCNTRQRTCVACVSNSDCEGKEIPLCDTTRGICDCPETRPYYDADMNYCGNCKTHSDCSQFGNNYLCLHMNQTITDNTLCEKNPGYNTCRPYTIQKTATIDGKEWVYVGLINHWNAERTCEALGKSLPTVKELITESDGSEWNGSVNVARTRTELAKKLHSAFNIEWIWTPSRYPWTSCGAVYVSIVSGWVGANSTYDRAYNGWTLCR